MCIISILLCDDNCMIFKYIQVVRFYSRWVYIRILLKPPNKYSSHVILNLKLDKNTRKNKINSQTSTIYDKINKWVRNKFIYQICVIHLKIIKFNNWNIFYIKNVIACSFMRSRGLLINDLRICTLGVSHFKCN